MTGDFSKFMEQKSQRSWEMRRKGVDGKHTPVHSPAKHTDGHMRGETVEIDTSFRHRGQPGANTNGTPSSAPLPLASASQAALSSFKAIPVPTPFLWLVEGNSQGWFEYM